MNSVKDHYDNLLAAHYSWMFGDFDSKVSEQKTLFKDLGLKGDGGAIAVDLGCGSGFQTFALANLGYEVISIDNCGALLAELNERIRGQAIRTVEADLLDFTSHLDKAADLIVCMGDTLSHLLSISDISTVFEQCFDAMASDGQLVLTYRDLRYELEDLDRFILLTSSSEKIMTCFLEYEEETVKVNDLIYIRDGGVWRLEKSMYRKLRLSLDIVIRLLEETGFQVQYQAEERGVITILAVKP
jgi:SAM-dependent methyltransferase